jgi:pimeloyl-ACP methyl ester carboxylesterase
MPNAHVQIVPDTGHLVFLETPNKYRELLLGFLGR